MSQRDPHDVAREYAEKIAPYPTRDPITAGLMGGAAAFLTLICYTVVDFIVNDTRVVGLVTVLVAVAVPSVWIMIGRRRHWRAINDNMPKKTPPPLP